ncbi:MAG: helix-turn-helix transcriptional regulator [Anaerolineae bacterium]|nr:helix-turn-helix transcriptional regulator [Anaerolineae bacterium]
MCVKIGMMSEKLTTFWTWVEQRMNEVGITSMRELARRAGVSHATISAYKNDLKPPTVETAEGLCRALRVDWVELWDRAGYVSKFHIPASSDLEGLDAEIYQALQGTGDDFKLAVLKTIRTWLILYEELRK